MLRLRSLRSRLLLWVFLPIVLISFVDLVATYHSTAQIATTIQQQLLHGSAKMIAEQLVFADGAYDIAVPPAAFELFENEFKDRVYYSVRSKDGVLISGVDELLPYAGQLPIDDERYYVTRLHDEVVRVIAYAHALPDSSTGDYAITQVAQTLRAHDDFHRGLYYSAIRRHLLLLVMMLVALAMSVRWMLSPLMEFGRQLGARQSGSLERFAGEQAPSELAPFILALNEYVDRLDRTLSSYEKFVANTAHHLRTSFAIIASQIDFGKRAAPRDTAQHEVLEAVGKTLGSCTKVINQLLVLASIEHRAVDDEVQLSAVISAVIEEMAPLASQTGIELGVDEFDESVRVVAPLRLLRELIANLVDNAIRHMGRPGEVSISLRREAGGVRLSVIDNGVGIPETLHQRVFERFFRIDQTKPNSSGLGLAIVKEICDALKASIALRVPAGGRGLQVDIRLPAAMVKES